MAQPSLLDIDQSVLDRFWSYVSKGPNDNPRKPWGINKRPIEKIKRKLKEECWEWQGSRDVKGYGWLKVRNHNYRTHRLAWIIHHKIPITEGFFICHLCDNPPCVNANHLWMGTYEMNVRDTLSKRITSRKTSQRKIMKEQFPSLIEDYKSGMKSKELGKKYNVHQVYAAYAIKRFYPQEYREAQIVRKELKKRILDEAKERRSNKVQPPNEPGPLSP